MPPARWSGPAWTPRRRSAWRAVAVPPTAGGAVLDGPEAQHVLAGLPAGLREQIEAHAAQVLKGEMVEHLVGEARRALERDRAGELLRLAFGQGDGDRADAVVSALGASPGPAGEADLDDLVRRATGGGRAGLASLARRGASRAAGGLTGQPG